jgi:hypothetical protein
MLGEKIAETVNTVYINGNGYSTNLNLSEDFNYKVYLNKAGYINMEYNKQNITIKLIPVDIAVSSNPYIMNPGQSYIVKNVNGAIIVTPA